MNILDRGDFLEIQPVSLQDRKVVSSLPGFIGRNEYLLPKKAPVIRNVLHRLNLLKQGSIEIPERWVEKKHLSPIRDGFKFATEPLKHQLIAMRYLITNKGGGLLLDPGLGKTKVCLDYIYHEGFNRVLIICPKPLQFVWEDEISTHRPELSYTTFTTTDWPSHANLNKSVWIINYKKACMLLPELLETSFDAMFIDEGLVKNPSSDQSKAIQLLSKRIPVRVIMSGTLVNNSEIDLYSPVRILEPSLVGGSYSKFRDTYFKVWMPVRGNKNIKSVGSAIDPELVRDILRSCSIIMRKEEWLTLPEKVFIERVVAMPSITAKHYWELLSNYVTKIGDLVVQCDNPLSLMCKLMQISNGFVYENEDGFEDIMLPKPKDIKPKKSKRPTYFFPEHPKVDELIRILLDDEVGERVVVWYSMDAERKLIEDKFSQEGIKSITVAGGDKHVKEKVKQFNSDDSIKVLLCQAKTLNYGVTLLGNRKNSDEEDSINVSEMSSQRLNSRVCVEVFFSLTTSLEVFIQQQDRIHRIGQTLPCRYYLILSDSPVEQNLSQRLRDKLDIRDFMLEDILNKARDNFSYQHTMV